MSALNPQLRALASRVLGVVVLFTFLTSLIGGDEFNGIGDEDTLTEVVLNRAYFVLTTLSTVGYGDISPRTTKARCVTAAMMVMLLLSML